jgi:hypothetical protein
LIVVSVAPNCPAGAALLRIASSEGVKSAWVAGWVRMTVVALNIHLFQILVEVLNDILVFVKEARFFVTN